LFSSGESRAAADSNSNPRIADRRACDCQFDPYWGDFFGFFGALKRRDPFLARPKKCHFVSGGFPVTLAASIVTPFSSIFEKMPELIFVILRALGILELGEASPRVAGGLTFHKQFDGNDIGKSYSARMPSSVR
jgi:hypothetical protein